MTTFETVSAIDGVLGSRAENWLSANVELFDGTSESPVTGTQAVVARLGDALPPVDDVKLTIDAGRGVAEWVAPGSVPMACAFEIAEGLVTRIRIYTRPGRRASDESGE